MHKLYEKQKDSFYKICNDTGIPKGLLYQYATGTKNVDNMTTKTLYKLAEYLKMPMEQLYHEIKKYQDKEKKS